VEVPLVSKDPAARDRERGSFTTEGTETTERRERREKVMEIREGLD
jgi:hypothetical protein